MATALERLDAIVFTAGVGENGAAVREAVCARLSVLGVALDLERNRLPVERGDLDLAAPDSPVRVLRIHAREDLVIARAVRELLYGARALAPSATSSAARE
jgi:acetate kinase